MHKLQAAPSFPSWHESRETSPGRLACQDRNGLRVQSGGAQHCVLRGDESTHVSELSSSPAEKHRKSPVSDLPKEWGKENVRSFALPEPLPAPTGVGHEVLSTCLLGSVLLTNKLLQLRAAVQDDKKKGTSAPGLDSIRLAEA
eukprot:2477706-Amphidinium_carterae.1